MVAVAICFFISPVSFSVKFLKHVFPFLVLLVFSLVVGFFYNYKAFYVIKDIFHFLKPMVGIVLGYIIFKKVDNFRLFIKTVVITGILSALIHFYILLFIVNFRGGIEDLREFTRDNFLELFSLFFLVFYKKFEGTPILSKKIYTWAAIIFLTISNILYFSRTMIIMAGIMVISVYGLTKITKQTVRLFALFVVGVVLLYSYLYSANIGRGKPGIEGFLYKVKMAPEEVFQTRIDRDNKAQLWDHWRGYEAKRAIALMEDQPESFVFGTGLGSVINLKFYAPLTGDKKGIRYISELHNGYMYILYKTGAIGMLIYLFIMFRWYGYIYKKLTLVNVLISSIGLIYVLSTVTITGLYNTRDVIIIIIGGALAFSRPQPLEPEEPLITQETL
jgi:hypothetical protein